MKYFIDTHDVSKGYFPEGEISAEEFRQAFNRFDKVAEDIGVTALRTHVSLKDGKAYCFTKGVDAEAVRRAHEEAEFPFDSITEVTTVTGSDL